MEAAIKALQSPEIQAQIEVWKSECEEMREVVCLFWRDFSTVFRDFWLADSNADARAALVMTALEELPKDMMGSLRGVCCPEFADESSLSALLQIPTKVNIVASEESICTVSLSCSSISNQILLHHLLHSLKCVTKHFTSPSDTLSVFTLIFVIHCISNRFWISLVPWRNTEKSKYGQHRQAFPFIRRTHLIQTLTPANPRKILTQFCLKCLGRWTVLTHSKKPFAQPKKHFL